MRADAYLLSRELLGMPCAEKRQDTVVSRRYTPRLLNQMCAPRLLVIGLQVTAGRLHADSRCIRDGFYGLAGSMQPKNKGLLSGSLVGACQIHVTRFF